MMSYKIYKLRRTLLLVSYTTLLVIALVVALVALVNIKENLGRETLQWVPVLEVQPHGLCEITSDKATYGEQQCLNP